MDAFAYISLGVFMTLAVAYGTYWVTCMVKAFGKGILLVLGFWVVALCAGISAMWLVGTKLI